MAGKDDIETAGAARVLHGLAGELAAALRARADAFFAEAADPKALERELRAIVQIARAGVAVQGLQAAEDKADERAMEAAAQRAVALVRIQTINPDEGDETDMHERDPRLDDPKAMAEVSAEIDRRVDRLVRLIEEKSTPAAPCRREGAADAEALDRADAPGSAPTH